MAIKYQEIEASYPGFNREDFFEIDNIDLEKEFKTNEDLLQFKNHSIQNDTPVVNSEVFSALSSLCDLGWKLQKTLDSIESVQSMIDDLAMTLQNYADLGSNYQETIDKLFKLLDEAGISRCVKGLVSAKERS